MPEAPYAALLAYFRNQQIQARIAAFKPADVPALMIYPQGAETVREARQALEEGDSLGGLTGLVQDYLERKSGSDDDFAGTLYLNASCPLVRRLAEDKTLAERQPTVLALLHQTARLFAGRMISPLEAVQAFREFNRAIESMLS